MSWKLSLGGTLIVSTMVRYTTLATCFPNPSGLPLRKEIRTRGIDGPPGWRRVARTLGSNLQNGGADRAGASIELSARQGTALRVVALFHSPAHVGPGVKRDATGP